MFVTIPEALGALTYNGAEACVAYARFLLDSANLQALVNGNEELAAEIVKASEILIDTCEFHSIYEA